MLNFIIRTILSYYMLHIIIIEIESQIANKSKRRNTYPSLTIHNVENFLLKSSSHRNFSNERVRYLGYRRLLVVCNTTLKKANQTYF